MNKSKLSKNELAIVKRYMVLSKVKHEGLIKDICKDISTEIFNKGYRTGFIVEHSMEKLDKSRSWVYLKRGDTNSLKS